LYVTAPHKQQAEAIAQMLLEQRLAACINILPGMTSFYRWEGELQRTEECLLLAKTHAHHLETIIARVCAMHSYEVPCILALPVAGGHEAFLRWAECETADAATPT